MRHSERETGQVCCIQHERCAITIPSQSGHLLRDATGSLNEGNLRGGIIAILTSTLTDALQAMPRNKINHFIDLSHCFHSGSAESLLLTHAQPTQDEARSCLPTFR